MSLPWFRLYHRMVDDDKLRLLAFEDRWHFVALCCLKAEGLLDEPDSDVRTRRIAVKLGVQVRELEEIGRRLREVDLIDTSLTPLNWATLQVRSDSSTERVRKHREKQALNEDETVAKRFSNAPEEEEEEDKKEVAKATSASDDAPALKPVHVFEHWNTVAARIGKRQVRDHTPARVQLVRCRIGQYSLDDFAAVFAAVGRSAFLREGRFCTFDWLMKRANFQKVLEGNYDD